MTAPVRPRARHRFRIDPSWGVTFAMLVLLGSAMWSVLSPPPIREVPAPTVTVTATPTPSPTYDAETRFAEVVERNGVEARDVNRARGVAFSICNYLDAGMTPTIAVEKASEGWGYGARETAVVVGMAHVFCPTHEAELAPLSRVEW